MKPFLSGVLGVIAIGVLLIVYGTFHPRVATADSFPQARGAYASDAGERFAFGDANVAATPQLQIRCASGQRAVIRQVAGAAAAECLDDAYAPRTSGSIAYPASDVRVVRPVRVVQSAPVRRRAVARVERRGRDWGKTAMVIGGTSAAGAGIGALFGGKKGALIGAAIGGGAGTLYEVKH